MRWEHDAACFVNYTTLYERTCQLDNFALYENIFDSTSSSTRLTSNRVFNNNANILLLDLFKVHRLHLHTPQNMRGFALHGFMVMLLNRYHVQIMIEDI